MRLLPLYGLFSLGMILACGAPGSEDKDADDDGYDLEEDCNDAAADINPGAAERCDPGDVDEDCNGLADNADPGVTDGMSVYHDGDGDGYGDEAVTACEVTTGYTATGGDCDDADPTVHPDSLWYADDDGDGFGDASASTTSCEQRAGFVADATDCDDGDAAVNPETEWHVDDDGDGYGAIGDGVVRCAQPAGYVLDTGDCDDGDTEINPGETEVCDAADTDEDCDSLADDADDSVAAPGESTFYTDADGDGYGGSTSVQACDRPAGHVAADDDCDDANSSVYPGATEVCDAADADEDCDGLADDADSSASASTMSTFYADTDGDGYGTASLTHGQCDATAAYVADATDCDDGDAAVSPVATETWYDDIDSDCAGDDDYDQDADGLTRDEDCDDTDPTYIAPTDELFDGRDNDCDGSMDEAIDIADAVAGILYGTGASLGARETLTLGGDFDGDGLDDLVLGQRSGTGYAWVVPGTAAVGAAGAVTSYDDLELAGIDSSGPLGLMSGGPAGDLTGDGTADVLVSRARTRYSSYSGLGAAFVFDGSGSGSTSSWFASFTAPSSYSEARSLAAADIDGDGVDDLVVGDPTETSTASYQGSVSVWQGPLGGGDWRSSSADDRLFGIDAQDNLGYTVAAGDLDGDGYADVLASAINEDTGGSDAGAVYLLLGNATLSLGSDLSTDAQAVVTGTSASGRLGTYGIPTPGDLDGDGTLDLALPSTSVYVFLDGSTLSGSAALGAADVTVTGTSGDTSTVASTVSDFDRDGADELVLGCPGDDTVGTDAGAVYVFSLVGVSGGSWTSSSASASIYGSAAGDAFGEGLATGGDLDGDGSGDLLVGAPGSDGAGTGYGAVYVLLGW
ncbi:MAG: MopE-related protein [Pseudomonadota bacterium]|nr:MopE-related protein [Pseudomonadota bacterium]